ncbi:MAG: hypothetical protein E4H41_05025 [Gemmatimonadales bacterium]|nr:MAG: hypothetical protein E4H41_05025 [Gemmatimonadales bacterium]
MSITKWSTTVGIGLVSCTALLACGEEGPATFGAVANVTVQSTLTGAGSGNVNPPAGLEVEGCAGPIVVGQQCFAFYDAGAGGIFAVTAEPDAFSAFGAWGAGCDSTSGTACHVSFDDTPATIEVSVRFDPVDAVCTAVKSGVPNSIAGTGPKNPILFDPAYGAQALANPSFESVVTIGTIAQLLPDGYGYWQGDRTSSVVAQQGIQPADGDSMLQFINTGIDPGSTGTSEIIQLVKLSHLEADVDSGWVTATLTALFNRVAGCSETDASMLMVIAAMPGDPAESQARWVTGLAANVDGPVAGGWLARFRAGILADGDPLTWELAYLAARVPPGTKYLVIDIGASENVKNDLVFPELHGHYADSVSVVLTLAL